MACGCIARSYRGPGVVTAVAATCGFFPASVARPPINSAAKIVSAHACVAPKISSPGSPEALLPNFCRHRDALITDKSFWLEERDFKLKSH